MKKKDILILLLLLLLWISPLVLSLQCNNNYRYVIYSSDKKQCITLISTGTTRYIINGNHRVVPDTNYVKLDIKEISGEMGDEVLGCFADGYKWKVYNPKATILENKLDTLLYRVVTNSFPLDESGIPTVRDYKKYGCFNMAFDYKRLNKRTLRGDAMVK